MTAQELKIIYAAKLAKYPQENIINVHWVTDTNIVNKFCNEVIEIPLQAATKVINLYNEAKDYIRSIKIGDMIIEGRFGRNENCKVLRINKAHKEDAISSFSIETIFANGNSYKSTIKPADIVYKGYDFYTIKDAYNHASGKFLSFSSYDKKHIEDLALVS